MIDEIFAEGEREIIRGVVRKCRCLGLAIALGVNIYYTNMAYATVLYSFPFLIAGVVITVVNIVITLVFLWISRR